MMSRASRTAGLSLTELLLVLLLFATLATLARPGWEDFNRQLQLRAASRALAISLQSARTTAMTTGLPHSLCPSADGLRCGTDDWHDGWLVYSNPALVPSPTGPEAVHSRQAALAGDVRIIANRPVRQLVTYTPSGDSQRLSGALLMGSWEVCSGRHGQTLTLSASGRVRFREQVCTQEPAPGL